MTFDEYQAQTNKTAMFPNALGSELTFVYIALGLAGESGEIVEKVKKILRDDQGKVSDEKKEEIKKELGDVLWYLAQMAEVFDIPLSEVAATNIQKTHSRLERGTLRGSGDNR